MIPKRIGKIKTSRTYLYNLAWYRANSLIPEKCDYENRVMFHKFNSVGTAKFAEEYPQYDMRKNGWANGQWMSKRVTDDLIDEIQKGNFCKAEFYKGKFSWYWKKALLGVIITTPFFPYSRAEV